MALGRVGMCSLNSGGRGVAEMAPGRVGMHSLNSIGGVVEQHLVIRGDSGVK